jgi:hypothetical protein
VRRSLETAVPPPTGFTRIELEGKGFGAWLRRLPLLPDGAPLRYGGGQPRLYQTDHFRVVDLDTPKLQQCSDSIQRLRAEWLWSEGRRREIGFRTGKSKRYVFLGRTRADLAHYLKHIYTYAGTSAMATATSRSAKGSPIVPGDILIHPARAGKIGHVVMVLDVAVCSTGRRLLLIGQGYPPAQQFHIARNPLNARISPWFAEAVLDLPFGLWTTTSAGCGSGDLRRY